MASKIKIAFFTGSFQYGGTERYLLNMLKNIDRQIFEPTVMCFYKSGELLPEIQRLNINIEVFPINKGLFNPTGIKSFIKAFLFFKNNNIQILHTLADWANFFGVFAGKFSGAKVIIVSQRNMGHWIDKKFYFYITKIIYRYLSNGIVVNAYSIKKHLTNEFGILPSKIEVIHNGISFNDISGKKKSEARERSNRIVAGFIGRFHPVKGFSVLLDAAQNVIKNFHDIEFLIVGNGPERDEILIKVENYKLNENFKFVGYQKDVLSFIYRMDFVILPSKSEGFPNVILEAMACQKPVVATRVGGVSEVVIDGETGIIIEPGDVTALSNSINNLCGNKDLRKKMGIAAFKRAHEHFGMDKMIEKHSKYYLGKIT